MPHPLIRVARFTCFVIVLGACADEGRSTVTTRPAALRIPVEERAAAGTNWALRADSGFVVLNTLDSARSACASLGHGWALPSGADDFPDLDPWPTWPTTLDVWTAEGGRATLGTGGSPPRSLAPAAPGDAEQAVLCVR